jgi:multidrug efflux pump subunit AcrB
MGVVKKNAIPQVDYTDRAAGAARPRGQQRQADRARLRPILMTTLATAGMLPVALGKGDGSASRAHWPLRWWAARRSAWS